MSDMRDLARRAMAGKLIADAAAAEARDAKEQLALQMAGTGAERVRVSGDDDVDYGTVVLSRGSTRAQLVDEPAFTAWVAKRYPDQLVMSVQPSFRDRVLASATRLGDPVDRETGEVIPGVRIVQGDPYVQTRPSKEAGERMRAALAAGGLLALGAAEAVA